MPDSREAAWRPSDLWHWVAMKPVMSTGVEASGDCAQQATVNSRITKLLTNRARPRANRCWVIAHVFTTGSADGLGRNACPTSAGVVLHARHATHGQRALAAVPGADDRFLSDLASIAPTQSSPTRSISLGPSTLSFTTQVWVKAGENASKRKTGCPNFLPSIRWRPILPERARRETEGSDLPQFWAAAKWRQHLE